MFKSNAKTIKNLLAQLIDNSVTKLRDVCVTESTLNGVLHATLSMTVADRFDHVTSWVFKFQNTRLVLMSGSHIPIWIVNYMQELKRRLETEMRKQFKRDGFITAEDMLKGKA
jgi:hypothetical protein